MSRIALMLSFLAATFILFATSSVRLAAGTLTEETKEIRLDNGLRIFVLERDFSPTFAALYQFKVGGAVDPKGRSGIAHLLEHMMFKGTESIGTLDRKKEQGLMARLSKAWWELDGLKAAKEEPFAKVDEARIAELEAEIKALTEEHKKIIVKNEYDELTTRAGAVSENAGTGWDDTSYFLQLPANQLEFWFQIERERLLAPVFREFYSERDVVREERRQTTENQAEGLAGEAMNGELFRGHPYATPVIGWPSEIEQLKQEDAQAYFRTYYSPGNCTMVFVGDVKAESVERLARKYLGDWKAQVIPPLTILEAPQQTGERRQVVRFDAEPNLDMGWNTVPEGHADSYPLTILGRILGGMESSRLDRVLVQEQRLASSVYAGPYHSLYEGSFEMGGRPQGDHSLEELEAGLMEQVRIVQEEGVKADEVERAKVSTEVSRVRRLESNLWLGFTIAGTIGSAGNLAYLDEYEARIGAVTPAQVQDVARRYLTPARRCTVEVRRDESAPEAGASAAAAPADAGMEHSHVAPPGDRGAAHSKGFKKLLTEIESAPQIELKVPEIGVDVERVVLDSGVTLFLKEDHAVPSVNLGFTWLGGTNTAPIEELAAAELAGTLLNEGGTETLSPEELEVRRDELGLGFNVWIGGTQSGGNLWSLSRNLGESFNLAMDIITHPRLDADRLQVIKGQYISRMKRRYDAPGRAVNFLSNYVLHGDHPRLGYTAAKTEIEAVTPEDIRRIADRYLGVDNFYVTAVGDFQRAELIAMLERRLGAWKMAQNTQREWLERAPVLRPGAYLLEKDIPQPAVVLIQEIAVDRSAPPDEQAAMEILNEILGGSGFRSRLMERLRSDEGLTYGIYSSFWHESREGVPGQFRISYQTNKDAIARSIESVMDVYRSTLAQGVTADEVSEQIQTWRNNFIFRFENRFGSVSRLMGLELDDRPYDYDRRQLAAIQAVTPAAVHAAAKKYLDPSKLSVCIFGSLTAEDETAIGGRYGLSKLAKEEVFKGGY